jgi:predicted deacetylase
MSSGTKAAVTLFLLMLTVQLTGLSCLDEWTMEAQSVLAQGGAYTEDECPCHFTFVSSISAPVQRVRRVTRLVTYQQPSYTLEVQFLLFRPPASA